MSNLLQVGARVKIVGKSTVLRNHIGKSGEIVEVDPDDTDAEYRVQVNSTKTCWFPASSIQEIKEQTMKIENETQAKAAREFLKSVDELSSSLFETDKYRTKLQPLGEDLQAALAAYESRKIELSEDALMFLQYKYMNWRYGNPSNHLRFQNAISELVRHGLIDRCNKISDAGRAYLDLRSQKREMSEPTAQEITTISSRLAFHKSIVSESIREFITLRREVK